jgi:hypothetical protein
MSKRMVETAAEIFQSQNSVWPSSSLWAFEDGINLGDRAAFCTWTDAHVAWLALVHELVVPRISPPLNMDSMPT